MQGTPVATSSRETPTSTSSLTLGIRPEYVELRETDGPNRVRVDVTAVHDEGTQLMLELRIGDRIAWSKVRDTRRRPQPGLAFAYLPPDKCALYVNDRRLA